MGELIKAGNNKELFRLRRAGQAAGLCHVLLRQRLARCGVGQTAELTIPEIHGKTFTAKVVRTAGAMNPESRTLLTELEVDNSSGEILAGSYAEVKLTDTKPDVPLTVPSNTLLFRSEGAFVGVVTPENKIDLRPVDSGPRFRQACRSSLAALKPKTASCSTLRTLLFPAWPFELLIPATPGREQSNPAAAQTMKPFQN